MYFLLYLSVMQECRHIVFLYCDSFDSSPLSPFMTLSTHHTYTHLTCVRGIGYTLRTLSPTRKYFSSENGRWGNTD